jgi:large subunit ribosomal protein L15
MKLNELENNPGAMTKKFRVGRGIGSGKGKTAGRGVKGQKARTGVSIQGFEGGQMPLYRRLPKRGFNNHSRQEFAVINLGQLQAALDAGKLKATDAINADALKKAGLITSIRDGVRLLGNGELKTKVNLQIAGASTKATEAVEKLGGKIELPVEPIKKRVPKAERPQK